MRRSGVRSSSSPPLFKGQTLLWPFSHLPQRQFCRGFPGRAKGASATAARIFDHFSVSRSPFSVRAKVAFARGRALAPVSGFGFEIDPGRAVATAQGKDGSRPTSATPILPIASSAVFAASIADEPDMCEESAGLVMAKTTLQMGRVLDRAVGDSGRSLRTDPHVIVGYRHAWLWHSGPAFATSSTTWFRS